MSKFLGTIIISIPLPSLNELSNAIPFSCISFLEVSSTFRVIRNTLNALEDDADLLRYQDGRCIVIEVYGDKSKKNEESLCTDFQIITSCLDYPSTKTVLNGIISLF